MKKIGLFLCLAVVMVDLFQHNSGERTHRSGALDALQFMARQRAYPGGTVNDSLYYAAYVKQAGMMGARSKTSAAADGNVWESMGPTNIGGRTLAIAINPKRPSTIYAGSASGGLWRSYTGGVGYLAWERVSTGYPVLAVSSIIISPADTNIMLIGTGEVYGLTSSFGSFSDRLTRGSYGIGILKTTDGGKHWKKSLDWSLQDQRGIQAVKIHPKYPNLLWAATTHGVYRSWDTGETWSQLSSHMMVTDIVLHPDDSANAIIAAGNLFSDGNGFYSTTNGGSSWNKCTNGVPAGYGGKAVFWLHPSDPPVVYASIGLRPEFGTMLVRSLDFGVTWKRVSTVDYAGYQAWYSHVVAVNPKDPSIVFCGGINLYRSLDSGQTLVSAGAGVHPDIHCAVVHPEDATRMYFGTDGGVVLSSGNGSAFITLSSGYQTTQFYNHISVSRNDPAIVLGGLQDNGSVLTGGSSFWSSVLSGDGCMSAINPSNDYQMWGSSQYLNIARSDDRGSTWRSLAVPGSGTTTSFVGPFAVSESEPNVVFAGRRMVYRSNNAGNSWVTTNNGLALDIDPLLTIAVAPSSADTVYAATAPLSSSASLYFSSNRGNSWEKRTGTLPDRYMIDIVVHPRISSTVFVTASGFHSGHLFQSTDAGITWNNITGNLPDVPTSAFCIDPRNENTYYLGNDLGVYVSYNGGKEWYPWNDGIPDAVIVMDLVYSSADESLIAATHGNGMYRRKLLAVTSVSSATANIPGDCVLEDAFPNPFNPTTTIRYFISKRTHTTLTIHDVTGRTIATLVNEGQPAGWKEVQWNASNFASGVYFVRMTAGSIIESKKVILMK